MGSRMLVGNLEFRFPLLRPFGASQRHVRPDPGRGRACSRTAASPGTAARSRRSSAARREGVASAGVAFRVNLLGFAVAEFDIARPFQRAGRQGWVVPVQSGARVLTLANW